MRVLWLTYGLPYPPDAGVRMRDYHLLCEVARGARVHLVSLVPRGPRPVAVPEELRARCEAVETFPLADLSRVGTLGGTLRCLAAGRPVAEVPYFCRRAAARLRALVERGRFDVVQIEHSLLAPYRRAVPNGSGCRTVLSLHNVAFAQYRSMARLPLGVRTRLLYRLKARLMRNAESYYAPRFDRCVVVSRREGALLAAGRPGLRPAVVENGVDCRRLRPLPEDEGADGRTLLFAGMMNYPPNADAAAFLCRSVLPLVRRRVPDARVVVAGHDPPAGVRALAALPGVEVTGAVPDMLPLYRRCTAAVVPLRAGGGTRLKVLESMALGRAVVSTAVGCEGLAVRDGVHLLVADGAEAFAACAARLLEEPALRVRLAGRARDVVERHYDWPVVGRRLVATYHELLAEAGAG